MKRTWLILFALWTVVIPLHAAMSDAQALKNARILFGPQAMIATIRDLNANNWTKQIGVKSNGCYQPFTVLGEGFNTWDAAFANYNLHPAAIGGPFKGTVVFKSVAYDNVAVTKFDLVIDSEQLHAVVNLAPAPSWDIQIPVNTTLLANGMHVVCKRAEDAAGNVGLSLKVWLFNVDQSIATGPTEWQLGPTDAPPSIDTPQVIARICNFWSIIGSKVAKKKGKPPTTQELQDAQKKLEDQAERLENDAERSGNERIERQAEKLQDGIEDLGDQLEKLEDSEKPKPPKPPKPQKKAKRIAIINNQTHQEITMDTIHVGSERVYQAEGRDAQNNPADLLPGDVPTYDVTPTGVVSLFPTSDGMSVESVAVAPGTCTMTCTGKNVKGDVVTGSVDINVPAPEPPVATRIELTAGPEIPV